MKLRVQRSRLDTQVFFQSTCCSALGQSATKCHRCYFGHIVQEKSRQLQDMGIKGFAYPAHHHQTQTKLVKSLLQHSTIQYYFTEKAARTLLNKN